MVSGNIGIAIRLSNRAEEGIKKGSTMNILISCCGRKVYLIKELKTALHKLFPRGRHKIITTDAYEYAPSLHAADKGIKVKRISQPGYVAEMLNICKRERIGLLLPTKDTELPKFSQARSRFEVAGTTLLLNSREAIKTCTDKWELYKSFRGERIRMPDTILCSKLKRGRIRFPVIVKERGRYRETSGSCECATNSDFKSALSLLYDPIIQKRICGTEYTVDAIFDRYSNPLVVVPRKRLKLRCNVSDVGEVVLHRRIIKLTHTIGKVLQLQDCCNLQFIEDGRGRLFFIEANLRISGGLQITLAACPHYLEILIRNRLQLPIQRKHCSVKEGIIGMKFDECYPIKKHSRSR